MARCVQKLITMYVLVAFLFSPTGSSHAAPLTKNFEKDAGAGAVSLRAMAVAERPGEALPGLSEESPYPTLQSMRSIRARIESIRRITQLKKQGVTIGATKRDIFFGRVFIGGRVDISEWNRGEIGVGAVITGTSRIGQGSRVEGSTIHNSELHESAIVTDGSEVVGATLKKGAQVLGSRVLDATVGVGSAVSGGSKVFFDRAGYEERKANDDLEEWSYDANHTAREHPTVIGDNCVIANQAYITNSTVADSTEIYGGSTTACEIGAHNKLHNLKATLVHTERDVHVNPTYPDRNEAVTEWTERWVGFGYRSTMYECYGEGLLTNVISTPYGQYHVAIGDPEGSRTVWSSFSGTGKLVEGEVVTGMTAKLVGSSAHATFRAHPLVDIAPNGRGNIVGMPDSPSPERWTPLTTTVLPGAIVSGKNPDDPGAPARPTRVRGTVVGTRFGPSWRSERPTHFLTDEPHIFAWSLMDAFASDKKSRDQGVGTEYRSLHGLPRAILEGRIRFIDELLAHQKEAHINDEVAGNLRDAQDVIRRHIKSGLWDTEVDDATGEVRLVHWKRFEELGAALKEPDKFADLKSDLVAPVPQWTRIDKFYESFEDPADHDPYEPRVIYTEDLEDISVYPERKGKIPRTFRQLDNVFIHPSAQIDKSVTIEPGTPDKPTVIGPGVVLRGRSVVRSGARLWRTYGRNTIFGNNGTYDLVRSEGIAPHNRVIFEADTSYSMSRFEALKQAEILIGEGSRGDHALLLDSSVGKKATLFTYARLAGSKVGDRCKIGCMLWRCDFGTGVTMQHLAARAYNTDAPDGFLFGQKVANASNFAAGSRLGDEKANRVTAMPGSFVGTHARIEPGCELGHLSVIIGDKPVRKHTKLPSYTLVIDGRVTLAGVLDHDSFGLPFLARMGWGYPDRYGGPNDKRIEAELVTSAEKIFWRMRDQVRGTQKLLDSLGEDLTNALQFIWEDLSHGKVSGYAQRVRSRETHFKKVDDGIQAAKSQFTGQAGIVSDLERLEVVCTFLRDGRMRMRGKILTDATWEVERGAVSVKPIVAAPVPNNAQPAITATAHLLASI